MADYKIEKVTYRSGDIRYRVVGPTGVCSEPFRSISDPPGYEDLREARGMRDHLQWKMDKLTEINVEEVE